MARDPELYAHKQWLGFLQPVGLVVSPPALNTCGAVLSSNVAAEQNHFLEHVEEDAIRDLKALLIDPALFNWRESDLVAPPDSLEVVLTAYHETLRATHAVPEPNGGWLLLIQELPRGTPLDDALNLDERHWQASPQTRFERLLRETGVPIGLLSNATQLRLVYYPRGETPGYITFPVSQMAVVAGRPALAALLMLLGSPRLFTLPDEQRLPRLLKESRKYQNTVSTQLAEQVLAALFELLRGFQAADHHAHSKLLGDLLARDPNQIYAGLVTVLMRLVFLLYAEDRGLMSNEEIYIKHYSVTGLFERLREGDGRYPDTMDQRYGGWGQLLALFRLMHDGGGHGKFHLPARHGYLFQPDKYPFLAGGLPGPSSETGPDVPLVSDGVIFRVLKNLLLLDGERISYRTLDVEQIGSVYEAIMGYRLEKAVGRSIALKPKKTHGAPITINLDALLAAADRGKWLKTQADQTLEGKALTALKEAKDTADAVAALEKKIAKSLTPNIVPPEAMVLQPSDERRRSGSHYTPRSLTGPIVKKALEPILKRLGGSPTPEQLLELNVCDPAMGSGAFLVEACRQLGAELVEAWRATNTMPKIPPDEDELLHAQRIIAQRCLYGVDKNPMAVDLAKLSLWLATLAKDHPFTFLDHNLRCGDSLVGLTREQIAEFHWKHTGQRAILQDKIEERIALATQHREAIINASEDNQAAILKKRSELLKADESLNTVRFIGNLVVAAFFAEENEKKRNAKRVQLLGELTEYLSTHNMALRPAKAERQLKTGDKGVMPFHWEIEFPEVFGRENGGFDAMIGNPPFMGGTIISTAYGDSYKDWLYTTNEQAGNRMDLVAYFFRRSFALLRSAGTLGLIATNTIAQGDTRSGGLRYICTHGGTIYSAVRRQKWPGLAAVVVSVVHIKKGEAPPNCVLDGRSVLQVTAFFFHQGGHDNPGRLEGNKGRSFEGFKIAGQGFLFDDSDEEASPTSKMEQLTRDKSNRTRIHPYIGGEEVNDSPTQSFQRWVIDFGDMPLDQVMAKWPALLEVVREKVKPYRDSVNRDAHRERWWIYGEKRPGLRRAIAGLPRVLANSMVGNRLAFAFLPADWIYSHALIVYPLTTNAAFVVLQSRIHEVWARFFGSSMKDDLRYTPSDCFETFPFPENFEIDAKLEAIGKEYYEFRAALMVKNNEGLTKTYNRFHNPNERDADILKLRALHDTMDRAVLEAYGGDLAKLTVPPCEFLLDYEEEEEETDPGATAPAKRQKKKPWRYRWPDEFRDEVLALLLDLNKQRAEQAKLLAPAKPKKASRGKKIDTGSSRLFDE